jgi:ABC-2 type transport system permease protein
VRNSWAVCQREIGRFFHSALAYIIVPVFLSLIAIFTLWFDDIFLSNVLSMRRVFFWTAVLLLLLVPAITMRLFSEEFRTGTYEALITLPISEQEIVWGKFLAALFLVSVALAMTFTYPITLSSLGDLDWGPVFGGYLALFLLGASFVAIGTAASASTSNQVVAFLIALYFCLLPFTLGFFLHRVPGSLLPLAQYLSFEYHFNHLARGVLDSRTVIFTLSVVFMALEFATFSLVRRRFQ